MTTDEERLAAIRARNTPHDQHHTTSELDDEPFLLALVDRLKAERDAVERESEMRRGMLVNTINERDALRNWRDEAMPLMSEVGKLRARVAKLESELHAFVFDVYASGESLPPKSLASFMKHIVPLDADTPSTDGGDDGA